MPVGKAGILPRIPTQQSTFTHIEVPLVQTGETTILRLASKVTQQDIASGLHDRHHFQNGTERIVAMIERVRTVHEVKAFMAEPCHELLGLRREYLDERDDSFSTEKLCVLSGQWIDGGDVAGFKGSSQHVLAGVRVAVR